MDAVADYLAQARSGTLDVAFHGLRCLGPDAVPALQRAYHVEADPDIRALIVEVVWQQRQSEVTAFLAEAFQDPVARVWLQALDGLVARASPATIRVLRWLLDREPDPERRDWIQEALAQAVEVVEDQAVT